MDALSPTPRTRVRRHAERGRHDATTVHGILDEGLVCHVGFSHEGRTFVFPTAYGRIDDRLYVHGAAGNFGLKALATGVDACVTVTLVDGLVLARSAFHHSMNYRSVMLFGRATAVTDDDEKAAGLEAIVDHLVPGRSDDTRPPSPSELRSTTVVRFPITEGSAKVRTGGPIDEADDVTLPHWAGVIPLRLVAGGPEGDGHERGEAPAYVTGWTPARRSGGG